jgi:hypothetical protein
VARGWESKSVENQIDENQTPSLKSEKKKPTPQEIELRTKRQSILLARSRTVSAMQSTGDERYRTLLQRTLEHLDSELAKFQN